MKSQLKIYQKWELIGLLLVVLLVFGTSIKTYANQIVYINPKPGSELNPTNSQIIIKLSDSFMKSDLNKNSIFVNGDKSGYHSGEIVISDENVVIFKPYQSFSLDENINVIIKDNLLPNSNFKGTFFNFKTTNRVINNQSIVNEFEDETYKDKPFFNNFADTIPSDLPLLTFQKNDTLKAYNGYILIATQQGKADYAIIFRSNGEPYKWRKVNPFDFQLQLLPNGRYAYQESIAGVAPQAITRILDSNFNLIKSYQCGNELLQFPSDYKFLPNGHSLLFARQDMSINMRDINPKGNPNATVTGTVFQEIDANNNVVFQWRAIDYLPINESYENLTAASINYSHMNGIDIDWDGNYLLSVRHLAQIIKINRNTGDIMWRLGGKANQFTFINENEANKPLYFNYQHNIMRLPNGNIGFFDNGNLRTPKNYSRPVEYKIDENAKTCELIWEKRQTPDFYSSTQGGYQILPNGNRLINWGSGTLTGQVSTTELTPSGEEVMSFSIPKGLNTYRTYKIDLPACPPVAKVEKFELLNMNSYNFKDNKSNTGISLTFTSMESPISYNSFTVTKYNCTPENIDFDGPHPMILQNRVTFEKTVIANFSAIVILKLDDYAKNLVIEEPLVFFRDTVGVGKFRQLPSDYDPSTNSIAFRIYGTGELIIGDLFDNNYRAGKPKLLTPQNNAKVNFNKPLRLNWTISGRYKSSEINIYKKGTTDSLIKTSISKTCSDTISINTLAPNTDFYWFVNSIDDKGISKTSDTLYFTSKLPYIEMKSPNGGEKFYKDSTSYIIKWESNANDKVRIELLKDDQFSLLIADSLISNLNNIAWIVPKSVVEGSNYKIQVKNIVDSKLTTKSTNNFSILEGSSVEDDINSAFRINEISPNPVFSSFNLNYQINKAGVVSISIIDLNGKEVTSISNEWKETGLYNQQIDLDYSKLSSGTYLLKIESGNIIRTKNIIIVK